MFSSTLFQGVTRRQLSSHSSTEEEKSLLENKQSSSSQDSVKKKNQTKFKKQIAVFSSEQLKRPKTLFNYLDMPVLYTAFKNRSKEIIPYLQAGQDPNTRFRGGDSETVLEEMVGRRNIEEIRYSLPLFLLHGIEIQPVFVAFKNSKDTEMKNKFNFLKEEKETYQPLYQAMQSTKFCLASTNSKQEKKIEVSYLIASFEETLGYAQTAIEGLEKLKNAQLALLKDHPGEEREMYCQAYVDLLDWYIACKEYCQEQITELKHQQKNSLSNKSNFSSEVTTVSQTSQSVYGSGLRHRSKAVLEANETLDTRTASSRSSQ